MSEKISCVKYYGSEGTAFGLFSGGFNVPVTSSGCLLESAGEPQRWPSPSNLVGALCQTVSPRGGYRLKSQFSLPSDCFFSWTPRGLPCAWSSGVSRGFMRRLSPDLGRTNLLSGISSFQFLAPLETLNSVLWHLQPKRLCRSGS